MATLKMSTISGLATQVTIQDAPCGCDVMRTKVCTWFTSPLIPIDSQALYTVRGYSRWCGDGNPGTYYATIYEYNSAGVQLQGHGSYYCYFEKGIAPNSNEWKLHTTTIGKMGTHKHCASAKYMSIGIGVNHAAGNGTYDTCGWRIIEKFK